MDMVTFLPVSSRVFTRSIAVVLGLICTFRNKETEHVSFLSGMTVAWTHGVYTCGLLFVQMNMVPSGVWKLLPRMNQTCGGLYFFRRFRPSKVTMLKGIFNVCFFFYPSTDDRCPSLQGIGKPPWSLWLNLCLKCTARQRDLRDTCICGVQR